MKSFFNKVADMVSGSTDDLPDASENQVGSGQRVGSTSVSSVLLLRDNSSAGLTAPRSVYDQATNCGNTSNTSNTSITSNVNQTEISYNMTEDPLRNFAEANSAHGAAFNSSRWQHQSTCLQNTRYGLLLDISRWSTNPHDACIFWLSGMAGTGKSTVSRTVAQRWNNEKRLGASFFFSRGQGDLANASKFFATLACQLAHVQPSLATPLREAILNYPDIAKQSLQDQWEHLIRRPLSQVNDLSSELILVIDALDECDGEMDVRLILHLLSQSNSLGSVRLKIFVTSRPETPIRLCFNDLPNDAHRDFALDAILDAVVDHDISVLLRHEFERIRKRHELPDEWPDSYYMGRLVQKAGGLFIYAATVCRFIGYEFDNPPDRLNLVLKGTNELGTPMAQLDLIYTAVLRHAVTSKDDDPEEEEQLSQRFRQIIGPIMVLRDTLTAAALTELLRAKEWEVKQMLQSLGSVLRYSDGGDIPITLLHPSFRDFLLDNHRCQDPRFAVVVKDTHRDLAAKCLELMSRSLRQDICSLKHPGTLNSDIVPEMLQRLLSTEVRYACRYWVDHLQQCNVELCEGEPLHDQVAAFMNGHFLHWLEVLSLLGYMHDGILMVKAINSIISRDANPGLRAMISDAVRFIQTFRAVTEIAPLQVYCTALLFSPRRSTVRGQFWHCVPDWISETPMVPEDWDSTLQVLNGHSGGVNNVGFSPDGGLLATGSDDKTVRLWDPTTGTCRNTLKGHSAWVRSVTFSPDGKLLASGSNDNTVKLWDPVAGTCHSTLEGHSGWIRSVTFSADGKLLASGSDDFTIRLWDPATGTYRRTLKGHSSSITSVAFSPDCNLLASGSGDKTLRLWDSTTGTYRSTLKGHLDGVKSVAFSPDGKLLASGSDDCTIRLWDPATGVCRSTLGGHSSLVISVAFSPDAKFLVSGSYDKTVRLWDPATGTCHGTLKGHSNWVRSVAFSPDGKLFASGSYDNTVRLWSLALGICRSTLEGHSSSVASLAFSPDGKLLASGSGDNNVRLWDPAMSTCRSTLKGHSYGVRSLAFSSDGKLFASGSYDNTVRLWDPVAGTCRSILKGHSSSVTSLAFSPDGMHLASGSGDDTIWLWDPVTGTCLSTLKGHSSSVTSVAFSPTAKLLASGSYDKTVRLWDLTTGTCRSTLKGHSSSVTSVAFSPDGLLLASGSGDKTLRLWDPVTGTCCSTLSGHLDWVRSVAFSSDCKLLRSTADNDVVLFWDVDQEKDFQEVHARDTRSLLISTGRGLKTNQGFAKPSASTQDESQLATTSAFLLHVSKGWILLGERKLLLLPRHQGEPLRFVRSGSLVAIGYSNGIVSFVGFNVASIP